MRKVVFSPGETDFTADQICEAHGCAEGVEDINVESWELTGKILCADCAAEDFERRSAEGDE